MSVALRILDPRDGWTPGETLQVEVEWSSIEPVEEIEMRLLWHTRGRGDEEEGVATNQRYNSPGASSRLEAEFVLPRAPWSYNGELLTIGWQVDAVLWPSGEQAKQELTLSPTGSPLEPLVRETVGDTIAQMPEGRLQSLVSWLAARRKR